MALTIHTARGLYLLDAVGQPQPDDRGLTLTLSLVHRGGIERFGFRCRIAGAPAAALTQAQVLDRLARWLGAEFEQAREAALKSIRAEGRLHLFTLDLDPAAGSS